MKRTAADTTVQRYPSTDSGSEVALQAKWWVEEFHAKCGKRYEESLSFGPIATAVCCITN